MTPSDSGTTPRAFWDEIHGRRDAARPGRPHEHLADLLGTAPPGRALELGSGDGADAIWLARHGWTVTAVDVSPVVLGIGARHADGAGVADRITWQAADLDAWRTDETFDLACSFFLHAPFGLDRTAALARAAARVRPGGHLLVVGHLTLPPWAWNPEDTAGLPTASQLVAELGLDAAEWELLVVEDRPRTVGHRDGRTAEVLDAVLHARRHEATA
ncbi:class I SAM-dependent methyltransferase [Patulibacter sp. SYSU D01012]|uniref:class I SAM-dependent methyltransferase n=1 Tax=Patulibacter sp. SYSU D01012 TaxID=2817381 RepID=UPI001B3029B9|nr:class I SAM-dependent methyltransferase [Patulibacter sp. SYSU D01012]